MFSHQQIWKLINFWFEPGKQIRRNIFSAQKATEWHVGQLSELVNSQTTSSVTEIRTPIYWHPMQPLPLVVLHNKGFPWRLKAFSLSSKSELWDVEHVPSAISCLLRFNSFWCPEDFALVGSWPGSLRCWQSSYVPLGLTRGVRAAAAFCKATGCVS